MLTNATPAVVRPGDDARSGPRSRRYLPDRRDLLVGAACLLAGVGVMYHLLRHPAGRVLRANAADDLQFQWMLAHGARVLSQGVNPFFSGRMNVPDGVNLMANTSVLGLSLPAAPVTLLFGTGVSYALLMVASLAGTALAWYLVLRRLVDSRVGAAVGGLFCGFAPGMISHANSHLNFVAQFLVPFLIVRALRLREPGRALRNGIALGLLVTWQAFINEEILLVTALGFGLFLACYAAARPAELKEAVRPALRGLLVTAAVAGVLLGYPLWVQFFGPQAYHGLGDGVRDYGADVASFTAFPGQSLAGGGHTNSHLAQNATEENSFLGWPLVVLFVLLVAWLRRYAAVRALAIVAVVFGLLSLGPRLIVRGRLTHHRGPFALLHDLPLFDSMVPTRLALVIIPVLGILLAFACSGRVPARRPARLVGYGLVAAALLPLVPLPLRASAAPPVPAFIGAGTWRGYVPAGDSLVAVPLPSYRYAVPLRWAAATGLDLPLARGYFLGPSAGPGTRAIFGAPARSTSTLLDRVLLTGAVPELTTQDRANALADLRYWHGAVVVLQPGTRNDGSLWETTSQLLGFTPALVGGMWVWDVRDLTGSASSPGRR